MSAQDDIDITETSEWLDALKAVQAHRGVARTQFLLGKLREEALRTNSMPPFLPTTPYRNTIPPEQEAKSPGDRAIEHRLRSIRAVARGCRPLNALDAKRPQPADGSSATARALDMPTARVSVEFGARLFMSNRDAQHGNPAARHAHPRGTT